MLGATVGTEVARGSATFSPHPKLGKALAPPRLVREKFLDEEDDPLHEIEYLSASWFSFENRRLP